MSPARYASCCLSLLALGCTGGDAACDMRQQVDDHSIFSCAEAPDLDRDEYEEFESNCDSIPGRENYVSSRFIEGTCPRDGIVGGCDLGGGRRLWYYPNEENFPATDDDMIVLCVGKGEVVKP